MVTSSYVSHPSVQSPAADVSTCARIPAGALFSPVAGWLAYLCVCGVQARFEKWCGLIKGHRLLYREKRCDLGDFATCEKKTSPVNVLPSCCPAKSSSPLCKDACAHIAG